MNRARWEARASSDWMGVVILAVIFILKGASYLGDPIEVPSAERWMPLWFWAGLWLACGAVAVVAVIARRGGPAVAGLLTSVVFLWGLMYEYDFLRAMFTAGEVSRGWAPGSVYLGFAAILWWSFRRGEPVHADTVLEGLPEGEEARRG